MHGLVPASEFATLGRMRKFISALILGLSWPVIGAQIDFNLAGTPAGPLPPGFRPALAGAGLPGQWSIQTDAVPPATADPKVTSPIRQGVLAQTAVDATDEHFPLCVYDGYTFRDFKFTTRFKLVSGFIEQMGGIVFRYQNPTNFYVLRVSALGHNIRFYKMVNGTRSTPIGPAVEITTGTWHTLAVTCEGTQIICWLDDKPAMPPLNDTTFATGKVGFWTKSDAVTYFTDASVNYVPRVPAAQALVDRILEKQPRIVGLRIYTLNTNNATQAIASNVADDVGHPGTDAEKSAITDGKVFFGRGTDTVVVTLPFRDRNGDPMAAVRVELKDFFGETEDTATTRAVNILKLMQDQITSTEELLE